MKRFDVVDREFVRAVYDVLKAYLLCTFPRKVVWIIEYLSVHILNQTYILSGVISISCMLRMYYSSKWLASFVGSIAQEQEEKIPTTNQWGIVKKTGGLQRKCFKEHKVCIYFLRRRSFRARLF